MRKLIARSALALFAVVAMSSTAWADYVRIGTVSFNDGVLSLTNQTGDNFQGSDFPVMDFVDFSGIFLNADGAELNPGDELVDTNVPFPGYNFDSAPFRAVPLSVLVGGSVANQIVQLFGLGAFNIAGSVFMCVTDPGAPPCGATPGEDLNALGAIDNGSFGIIYVEGRPVPEPVTFSLIGLGIAGVLARRRAAARR